jgi:HAD superfamily hydrolase (TIGR01509 family)
MPETSQIRLPRAILFDHDGVLVRSEPLHWKAWREVLRELGLPYVESEIQTMVGFTAPQIMSSILDKYRPGWDAQTYDVHALAKAKNDRYLVSAQTELQTYPGVRELLTWLRSTGIKTAVVSNAKRRELESALRWIGIHDFFDLIISRDDAGIPKPDPTPYLMAAASLGFEAHECLAVEDSPTGIESALVGKVPAAAVLTNFPRLVMEAPVPGRPDLKPVWVGESIQALMNDLIAAANSSTE